jgi:hypothetical protein
MLAVVEFDSSGDDGGAVVIGVGAKAIDVNVVERLVDVERDVVVLGVGPGGLGVVRGTVVVGVGVGLGVGLGVGAGVLRGVGCGAVGGSVGPTQRPAVHW